ncbi:hypothetical protein HPB49_013770 [Dermacentor silvarum]|uniref:Uncharacterized protein n=1 Tax=Dermacentor silvarum TaxID=543639 RepID=A0ACB8DZY9_DERSI|nr:hypothetical protein HPB49_013770 [Dermacentor silvarum]
MVRAFSDVDRFASRFGGLNRPPEFTVKVASFTRGSDGLVPISAACRAARRLPQNSAAMMGGTKTLTIASSSGSSVVHGFIAATDCPPAQDRSAAKLVRCRRTRRGCTPSWVRGRRRREGNAPVSQALLETVATRASRHGEAIKPRARHDSRQTTRYGHVRGRDEILEKICAPGCKVLEACMLGRSTTAVVTFADKADPFYILYNGGDVLSTPFHHTEKACHLWHQVVHRTDVCPTPDLRTCPICGTHNSTPQDIYTPKWALC